MITYSWDNQKFKFQKMNRKSSQQIYIHPELSLNNKNAHRPLLDQTLPKYRKQILERNLDNYTKDLTSRVKEKYRNFGEEEFLKKLKYNSTKQIDRKSIKAIDKYLHEMNKQKQQPMGYLHRTTSMNGFNTLNQRLFNNENEQHIESSKIKLNKKASLSIIPSTNKTQSEQTVDITRVNQNLKGKNKSKTYEQNLQYSEEQTIRQSAKFREKYSEKWENKHNYGSRQRNLVNILSFRDNLDANQQGLSSSKDVKPISRQFMAKDQQEQKKTDLLMSENHFYHKFSSPNTKAPNMSNKIWKQRPTVDSEEKKKEVSQGQNWITKNNSVVMQEQLRILRQKNEQQQQIIKLQQIMIEKLNIQLQNVFQKLQQQKEIYKIQECDNNGKDQGRNILEVNERKAYQQSLICVKINEELNKDVQTSAQQWQSDFARLRNLLNQMEFEQQEDWEQQYPCAPFEVKQFDEGQFQPNVNQSGEQTQGAHIQSANYFYHRPTKPSYSFGEIYRSKDRQFSQLSNFFTLSSQADRRELEYSAGTDFEFDLIQENVIKEE